MQAGHCAAHAAGRERARANYDIRAWYRTPRWRALRRHVLSEQPLCPTCQAEGDITPAVDVDHIRRHEGDPVLFWDRANLQGLCKRHHSAKTARGE